MFLAGHPGRLAAVSIRPRRYRGGGSGGGVGTGGTGAVSIRPRRYRGGGFLSSRLPGLVQMFSLPPRRYRGGGWRPVPFAYASAGEFQSAPAAIAAEDYQRCESITLSTVVSIRPRRYRGGGFW